MHKTRGQNLHQTQDILQWQEVYQNMEARNKQLETEKAEIEKWGNEKIDFEVQREKEIVKRKSHLELSHILNREISTAYCTDRNQYGSIAAFLMEED